MVKASKRLIVALLALCLGSVMCAASAFAAESEQPSVAASAHAADAVGGGQSGLGAQSSSIAASSASIRTTGLYKVAGKWRYYENGVFAKKTGIAKRLDNGSWWLVSNGVFKEATGLAKALHGSAKGSWFFVKNGKAVSYTGMVKCLQGSSKGKWFYVKKGKLSDFTGLVRKSPRSKKWCYVYNGKLKRATGAVFQNGRYHFVKKGIRNTSYTGYVKINGSNYRVKNGVCSYDRYANQVYPDRYVSYTYHMYADRSEGVPLRYGPSASYRTKKRISVGAILYEVGYSTGYSQWIYVRDSNYNYGWVERDHLRYTGGIAKPVVYLYPEKKTDVAVSVALDNGRMINAIPDYSGGWTVTARPDGTIVNHADGKKYPYLFWDSDTQVDFDWGEGYVVKGSRTKQFLNKVLGKMGLSQTEKRDFIEFWLPQMKGNAYNLITFQTDRYTDVAKLDIDPKPDSMLRVFMAYKAIDKPIAIKAPTIEPFERRGFTVVEWGGSEVL